ncbi:hypothetical protein CCAX7_55650 [Capsulimonas corticalis]|uniref:Uncharacterized protein n=1 Tax=Capsulimonas corticalis TaxID=2219043 RepID=A0A402D0W7_9BACT|nr:hypothetical protein [Capsulimonas corticalis]BDI33514.1 hypothetical protein CCAX7_55650 [Capsulimonas corticalis]
MGATQWRHFIPYQPDIEAALKQLRNEVFERGDYSYGGLDTLAATIERLDPEAGRKYRERLALLSPNITKSRRPKSIESLLKKYGDTGAHSVLDIDHICAAPEYGGLSPVPEDCVVEIFGTPYPSRDLLSPDNGGGLRLYDCNLYGRWSAVYLVLFTGETPTEYYIEGCSGD